MGEAIPLAFTIWTYGALVFAVGLTLAAIAASVATDLRAAELKKRAADRDPVMRSPRESG
jgi:hypothetical protein